MADLDLENLHPSRKRRIAKEDDVDATVMISSDSSCQASDTKDVARGTGLSYRSRSILTFPIETAIPAHFRMSSNDALIPIHHTARTSLPLHYDMDESTTLSGNDGPFPVGRTDFLQYSLASNETFMDDEYIETFARAPLLFSHTMDGSSNYTRHDYETITHARAPLLCSHTMDGSSSLSAGHQHEATVLARAPLLASHTMDGSLTY